MDLVTTVTSIFGGLAFLALVTAGLVMMFSPARGRQMLKNTFTALILFVIGSMLFQIGCAALLHRCDILVRSTR